MIERCLQAEGGSRTVERRRGCVDVDGSGQEGKRSKVGLTDFEQGERRAQKETRTTLSSLSKRGLGTRD